MSPQEWAEFRNSGRGILMMIDPAGFMDTLRDAQNDKNTPVQQLLRGFNGRLEGMPNAFSNGFLNSPAAVWNLAALLGDTALTANSLANNRGMLPGFYTYTDS